MPGFWEQFLDYFTQRDELIREFIAEYKKGIQDIIAAIKGEEPTPPIPLRNVPFFVEGTVVTGTPVIILVKDDSEQGLGDVGRSGFILNDGAGSIYVTINDGKGKSKEIRIGSGGSLEFERSDNIWMDKVTLSCTVGSNAYRCLFSR